MRWWLALCGVALLLFTPIAGAGPLLRVAEDRLPRGLNPLFAEHLVDLRVGALLFSGLFSEDRFQRTVPVLAASIRPVEGDRRSYRVTLHPSAKWHDGRRVTADDVKFTFEVLRDPKHPVPAAGQIEGIAAITLEASDRFIITFDAPPADPARQLTFPILPAHLFRSGPPTRTHPFRLHPIGSGPYLLERFDTDGTLRLTRHLGYPPGRPEIPRIELREIRDKQIQMEALRFGNLEVVVRVMPRDLPDLERVRRIELHPYQTNSWWYLGFNLTAPPWSDLAMRQALSALIDVDRLLEPIGGGERITGPFVPSSPYYNHRAEIPLSRPDPVRARRLLEQAGYARDAQGRIVRQGKPLRLVLAVEKALPVAKEVAVNLEGQLKRAGIDVELKWLDPVGWTEEVVERRAFDLSLSQWSFDRGEVVFDQFHSQGRHNYIGYHNPQIDRWLQRARTEVEPAARRQANQEVHRLVAIDLPYLFLWTLTQYAAFSTEVRNVAIDPFTFFSQVHRWTLGGSAPPRKPEPEARRLP